MSVGGILTDLAIREAIDKGEIEIDPFDAKQLNPASYDLRLGEGVAVYDPWTGGDGDGREGLQIYPRNNVHGDYYDYRGDDVACVKRRYFTTILDSKKEPVVRQYKIGARGFVLRPEIGYLMHTAERIATKRFVPVLDGKSSLARLFVSVHETAGYGDAGFDGQYTLEVTVKHPIRLYAGMRIAQIRFHTMHGEVGKLYSGNYTGETSRGAVASRAYKQFEKAGGK